MDTVKTIEHKGVITKIGNNIVEVSIIPKSSCAGCNAKRICSVADSDNKTIEVISDNYNYNVGQEVNVVLNQSLGFRALFLGYVLPFIILMITLLISSAIVDNEGIIGVSALLTLPVYYLGLYFFKNKIKKTFSFKISKIL